MHENGSEVMYETLPLLSRPTIQLLPEACFASRFSSLFGPAATDSAIVIGDSQRVLRRVRRAAHRLR